jgi:hypothetical protein
MFSIFNKRKPNLNDEENEIEADIDISTTNTTHTSSITNQTLDLGNKDSGPCRLILTVRFILFTYKNLIIHFLSYFKYLHLIKILFQVKNC